MDVINKDPKEAQIHADTAQDRLAWRRMVLSKGVPTVGRPRLEAKKLALLSNEINYSFGKIQNNRAKQCSMMNRARIT